jgi:hypothetical protein
MIPMHLPSMTIFSWEPSNNTADNPPETDISGQDKNNRWAHKSVQDLQCHGSWQLQCKKHKGSASTEPSPLSFEPCQIFSRRKVGISFLAGGGCAKSQILTKISSLKHCFWTFYHYGILDTVQMNIFYHLDGPHPTCMVCSNSFSGCTVSNLTAHFWNIDGIKYLKFEPSTTSHCEHFALSFVRNHQKIKSQYNIYEWPFEALETCFLHCRRGHHCQVAQMVRISEWYLTCLKRAQLRPMFLRKLA